MSVGNGQSGTFCHTLSWLQRRLPAFNDLTADIGTSFISFHLFASLSPKPPSPPLAAEGAPQRSEVPQRVTHLNIGVQVVSLCFFVLAGQLTAAEEPDDQRRDTRTKSLKLSLSQVRGRKASRRQESVVDETGSEWSLMDFNVFVFF